MKRTALRIALLAAAGLALVAPASAQQRPADFVDAATVVPGIVVEARYATAHNFVGAVIDGYEKPICYLTRQAAAALAEVARDLAPRGLAIKAYDCYRPTRAVAHFVRWARDPRDPQAGKAEFYPEVDKRNAFRDGYIAERSGHSRGSTIDMMLVRADDHAELDMGTPFDFFSPRSSPGDRRVGKEAWANRHLLAAAMERRGFMPYEKEWWHFTLRAEPFHDTYFNFIVK
jgi:D-alanyl-D-alanine dipeptidase